LITNLRKTKDTINKILSIEENKLTYFNDLFYLLRFVNANNTEINSLISKVFLNYSEKDLVELENKSDLKNSHNKYKVTSAIDYSYNEEVCSDLRCAFKFIKKAKEKFEGDKLKAFLYFCMEPFQSTFSQENNEKPSIKYENFIKIKVVQYLSVLDKAIAYFEDYEKLPATSCL
jgi:hypothetical protein